LEKSDFHNSSIRWITRQENSVGIFNVDSVLRVSSKSKASASEKVFALGSGVLAGNMYHDQDLAVDPPYFFQIACSDKDHVIFRTYLHSDYHKKIEACNDKGRATRTADPNKKKFKSLKPYIVRKKALKLDNFDTLYSACRQDRLDRLDLSGKIEYETQSGYVVEIEFPVKHINFIKRKKIWQMETGPILFAGRSIDNTPVKIIESLCPCFVHANSFDKVFITTDFPFNVRKIQDIPDTVNYSLDCKLYFLIY